MKQLIAGALALAFATLSLAQDQTRYVALVNGGNVLWAWAFATAHIIAMSVCFWLRFRSGKWKSMRVIEPGLPEGERPA